MIRNWRRIFLPLLAVALGFTMTISAFADMGYMPLNTEPEWLEWKEAWIQKNQEAWSEFDPDLWFEQHYEGYESEQAYMDVGQILTREEFEAHMAQTWLENLRWYEERLPQAEEYAAAHPEKYVLFSPDNWAEKSWYTDREGYKRMWQVSDAVFEAHMWTEYYLQDEERKSDSGDDSASHYRSDCTVPENFVPDAQREIIWPVIWS